VEEAELAERLGEAFRLYSYQIKQGNIASLKRLMTEPSIEVTISFNGDRIVIKPVEPKKQTVENSENGDIIKEETFFKDLPGVAN